MKATPTKATYLKTENVYTLSGKHKRGFEKPLIPQVTLEKKQLKVDFGAVPDLSVRQRFRLQIFGDIFLRWVRPKGYSGAVPVYLVRCSRHGLYLDTPHGHRKYFRCQDCLAEAKEVDK